MNEKSSPGSLASNARCSSTMRACFDAISENKIPAFIQSFSFTSITPGPRFPD